MNDPTDQASAIRGNLKSFATVCEESTCKKRVTVCELFDKDGILLTRESNRCSPPEGLCTRKSVVSIKSDYPIHSSCNWIHAETRALEQLKEKDKPSLAIVFGHEFPCPECEQKLQQRGVTSIQIVSKLKGCGVRHG